MNGKLELILHEVSRQFKSQRAFYQTIGITQPAWEKYKNGETDFNNVRLSTYFAMTSNLFSSYEKMLIDVAIQAIESKWFNNIVEAFHAIKLTHARMMVKRGASIEIDTSLMENVQSKRNSITRIFVMDQLDTSHTNTITFQINIPSSSIPMGNFNRRNWFEKEIENYVVK